MKEKIKLSGVPETMLQTVYARAKESRGRGTIHDAKAEEITRKLDYDFSLADKDTAMYSGVIARTIVLDKLTKSWLAKHPGAVVVNIACGLDTRVYRMDTGKCTIVACIASRRGGNRHRLRAGHPLLPDGRLRALV